ncbi:MAG: FkbM family methyltransferase [Rhodospirillaceae bacterium]|nr:FkbM family methyltransferase [Rhodospirillaceae bacterium]
MALINININSGDRVLAMTLDLDETQPNEKTILEYVKSNQLYEPDVAHLMLQFVDAGDVVVDVGANVGFFTTLLATLTGPTGRVLSFEPGAGNLARLHRHIAINAFEHVTVVEQPASAVAGEVEFFINSDNSGGNALWDVGSFPGNEKSAAAPLPLKLLATTVDDEIKRLGLPAPKLIKIDTEGAELEVLRGCRHLLTGQRTPFVIAESHPFGLAKMNASLKELRTFMAGFGYATFALFYDGAMPRFIPLDVEIKSKHFINLLFTTPEHIARFWSLAVHDPMCKTHSPPRPPT